MVSLLMFLSGLVFGYGLATLYFLYRLARLEVFLMSLTEALYRTRAESAPESAPRKFETMHDED